MLIEFMSFILLIFLFASFNSTSPPRNYDPRSSRFRADPTRRAQPLTVTQIALRQVERAEEIEASQRIPQPEEPSPWYLRLWTFIAGPSGPKPIDLNMVAEEAYALLEFFSKASDTPREQQELIDMVVKNVLLIQKELRVRWGEEVPGEEVPVEETPTPRVPTPPPTPPPPPVQTPVTVKLDIDCIVCFDNVADTVVLPCKHLALCSGCCDEIGIRVRGSWRRGNARCPVCRALATDRITVFRS